jgi:putative transposase
MRANSGRSWLCLPKTPFLLPALMFRPPVRGCVRSRATIQLEVLALRHQLHPLERFGSRRLGLSRADRLLWVWLSRVWSDWRAAIVIVKPETVIA